MKGIGYCSYFINIMLSLDLKPHIDYMTSVDQGWLKYWYKIHMITNKHKNIQYIVKIIIYYNDTIITDTY